MENVDKVAESISIHAPLRERPFLADYLDGKKFISIHAPLRERPSPIKKEE